MRVKRLPNILYDIQTYIKTIAFTFTTFSEDGRINSSIDENKIINILIEKYDKRIIKPKIRMWYDILIFDYKYGWLPVNIKTTSTTTNDNVGNMAMCVHAYTPEKLDIFRSKTYTNGIMSKILITYLKQKKYNKQNKKDYYFIVLNKTNPSDIIINSLKGLTTIIPNINNLPFQVCWNKNRIYKYNYINNVINAFIVCLKNPSPSWKETLISDIKIL